MRRYGLAGRSGSLGAHVGTFDQQHGRGRAPLGGPQLGFLDLARGMGVAGTLVTKSADLAGAVRAAFATKKPHLIEVAIEGKR